MRGFTPGRVRGRLEQLARADLLRARAPQPRRVVGAHVVGSRDHHPIEDPSYPRGSRPATGRTVHYPSEAAPNRRAHALSRTNALYTRHDSFLTVRVCPRVC